MIKLHFMKYLIIIICWLFACISNIDGQTSTHEMKRDQQLIEFIESEITADGVLDESVWNEIEPLNKFSNFFPINDGPARFDTDVKIYQDGKYLNVAIIYHDSVPSIRVNSMKRDDYSSGFHLSDCVGMIIDPYSNQNRGYFFALNGQGSQLDALIANYDESNLSWDAIWESGVSVKGTDKLYEMKIPLSSFSYDQHITTWNFQFYTRDAKDRMYTVWNKFDRGFLQYDTRFMQGIEMENLSPSKTAKTTFIPSVTTGYQKNQIEDTEETTLQPSIDVQYKISDGLRIDATINPDFSQVEVDQQVTNLTRFNIVFPERRNFFIENSDMFTTLGAADNINPFYSRFIGASQDIAFGLKLSGNVASNTRIGLLNVQSKKNDFDRPQNYTVAAIKQQFGSLVNATAYLTNRQSTDGLSFTSDYNRVVGGKLNYLSQNRKWSGFGTFSKSFNDDTSGENHVFSFENNYSSRTWSFSTKITDVGKNYVTDIGFVPRINNYDAMSNKTIREGYTHLSQFLFLHVYPQNKNTIQTIRPLNASVDIYLDERGDWFETNYFYNTALFFSNLMSVYANFYHDDIQLKYAFDPLRNGQFILPGKYDNTALRIGFNSDFTKNIFGSFNVQSGSFYHGNRKRLGATLGYRILPLLSFELNYEHNTLTIKEHGDRDLQLIGLTSEVFFTNKLNWTTYLQFNEQIDNVNINSRVQWEYKPLSFIYLVVTNNYTESLNQKNWGISLKINRRLVF